MLRTLERQLQLQAIFDSIEFIVRRSNGLPPKGPRDSPRESRGSLEDALGIGDSLGDATQI